MNQIARETGSANLEHEMRRSYLDYAMSVIVGRALPDVRDGLKPVHRRVLYAMFQLGNEWNKPYKKSARITGDVIGKYHPHGDAAVYDTIVRMAQNFSMRYPLVEGQGNFGSVDGDPPAAMRYTEIRLQRIAHEMLADIDKETVDFGPNYDDTEVQPLVLPGRMPNLLVNGSSGIAVGMATNIPTHNLDEVVNACLAYMDNEDIGVEGLMRHMPGPDFPTAGIINGSQGIYDAYRTGRGKIYVRGRVTVEETKSGRQAIIISELPYQVNKKLLVEKISELVREKRITGIAAMRDESDRDGMRIYIEVKRGEAADVVVNNLYRATRLETVFGINMVALVDNQPRLFTLKEIIAEFIRHRREVVTRATVFDLRKARERAHVLEGQAVALSNIDQVVAVIKAAANPAAARAALVKRAWPPGVVLPMLKRAAAQRDKGEGEGDGAAPQLGLVKDGYHLSEIQAQAILDLRLHRLTGLEQEKIHREYDEVLTKIADLRDILDRRQRLNEVVRGDLEDVRRRYADQRRTEIVASRLDLSTEDLIAEEEVVVTLSHAGYAKSQPVADYRTQRRGGRGRIATRTREADFVARMFTANSHDTILCFSDRGQVYWLRVFQLPQAGRQARGKPLVNLLSLDPGEKVTEILPIKNYDGDKFVLMATANGTVAKCALEKFSRPRPSGLKAITFREDDYLVGAALTCGDDDILLFSDNGKAMRFAEGAVRTTARGAIGVRGMKLESGCRVISLLVAPGVGDGDDSAAAAVLASTENGYGKRTPLADFPRKGRGGKGVIAIKTSKRNGRVVGAVMVTGQEEAMLITDGGTLIRTRTHEISLTGRNTQGVRLIKLDKGERLIGMVKVEEAQLGNGDGGDVGNGDSDVGNGDSDVGNGDSDVEDGDSNVGNGAAGR